MTKVFCRFILTDLAPRYEEAEGIIFEVIPLDNNKFLVRWKDVDELEYPLPQRTYRKEEIFEYINKGIWQVLK